MSSSLHRMLAVLERFTPESPAWTAEGLAGQLGCSLPTAYRYVRELAGVGLLRRDAGASYVLGTRVIELDYQLRNGDPLLKAARGPIDALARASGYDTVLGTIFDDRIVTVYHALGAEPAGPSYGRGRRMPLFFGALSKSLLSALPRARLRKLHAAQALADPTGVPAWEALLAGVLAIRKAGFSITRGELDPELVGIAVPLVSDNHHVTAALGFILSKQRHALLQEDEACQALRDCALAVVRALESAGI